MKRAALLATLVVALCAGCVAPKGKTPEEKRASAMQMRDEALTQLYARRPKARAEVESAPGYAVLDGFSIHPGLGTFASGYGVIVDNKTKEVTHQKFWRFGIGPGLAVKTYHVVAIFRDEEIVKKAAEGSWLFGLFAEASLKFGDFGGTISGLTDFGSTNFYEWTTTGVALELIVLGTGKTRLDKELEASP